MAKSKDILQAIFAAFKGADEVDLDDLRSFKVQLNALVEAASNRAETEEDSKFEEAAETLLEFEEEFEERFEKFFKHNDSEEEE